MLLKKGGSEGRERWRTTQERGRLKGLEQQEQGSLVQGATREWLNIGTRREFARGANRKSGREHSHRRASWSSFRENSYKAKPIGKGHI